MVIKPEIVLPYMRNGWTGGQYSVFRLLLGAYLFVHFVRLTPWAWELFSSQGVIPGAWRSPLLGVFANFFGLDDAFGLLIAVTIIAAAASLLLVVGLADKWAAFYLCFALACLYGGDPFIAKQSLHYLGWMLFVHLLIPKAPYGSLAARGRPDPGGGWRFPLVLYAVTLLIFTLSYLFSSYYLIVGSSWWPGQALGHVFANPLPPDYFAHGFLASAPSGALVILGFGIQCILFFVMPFWFFRRVVHPALWSVAFGLQLAFAFLSDFADPAITMLLFHVIVFHPAWIKSRRLPEHATLFYDGTSVLCHRLVRFVLAEDIADRITFSPLYSEYFETALSAEERSGLQVGIVLKSDDGLLLETDAVIRILKILGGMWMLRGLVLSAFPRSWRNAGYQFVGGRRYRIFGRAETAYPNVAAHLRSRFKE